MPLPAWLAGALRLRLARFGLLLALGVLAGTLWRGRLLPPLNSDSLIYHLTLPALWMHQGLLAPVELPFHDSAAEHAPMLTQVLSWLLMRATGDDGLTWLVQPAFLLLAAWLFFRSARLMGLPRPPGILLTGVMLVYPPFAESATVVNNELALTAFCAMFLYGLLRRPWGGGLLWCGLGLGGMLATKVVAVVYVCAGLAVLLPALARELWRREGPGRLRLAGVAAAALAMVLAGSGFYFRNWATLGNPLYPDRVSVGGHVIFPGLYDASVLRDHHGSPRAFVKMLIHDANTFAPQLPISGLLAGGFLLSAGLAVTRRRRLRFGPLAAGVLFPLLATLLYFQTVPFWREYRLLFPVYYALGLSAAGGLGFLCNHFRRGGRGQWWVLGALLALILLELSAAELWRQGWFWAVAAGAAGLGLIPGTGNGAVPVWTALWHRPAMRRAGLVAALAGAIAAIFSGPGWYAGYSGRRAAMRLAVYDSGAVYGGQSAAWALLDRLAEREGPQRIAYAGTPIVYPLFGPRLANRVFYVPLSPRDRPQPVELKAGDSVYLRLAQERRAAVDEGYWLAGLRAKGASVLYLVDYPDEGGTSPELAIVRRHPEWFRVIMEREGVYVFALADF